MNISELYKIYTEHPVVTTDSRNCPEGSIFIALKGASFDGNKFAATALEKGCAYAIVDEPEYAVNDRCILVDNCLTTFKELARYHRRQFSIPVIGITGTNGKTTTKELVSAVLARKYRVMHTEGNFNNDVGVPKTLLRLRPEHEIAVVEMGASHPGDIKKLVEYVEPQYGIITNVGRAHLLGFGSFEGVVKTKGELYDFLRTKTDSTVFINNDDEHLKGIAHDLTLIEYGTGTGNSLYVSGRVVECAPTLTFEWRHKNGEWHKVESHLIGSYNLYNMLAAATVGIYFGVSEQEVSQALEDYIPSNNRSQLEVTAHNKLIVDAYNANPTSMMAALKNFRDMKVENKMAILGDMRELGAVSEEEHQRVVDFLKDAGMENIWLVGEEFGKTSCPFRKFKDVEEVKKAVAELQPENHYILIKGSNGIKLYQLPELL